MARIRTIKPEFFTSLSIADLSLGARLLFIGLWTHVDDHGRCIDEPRLIKAALHPLDDDITPAVVDELLCELATAAKIRRYQVDGGSFIEVAGFDEHQKIDRKKPSKFPPPTNTDNPPPPPVVDGSSTDRRRIDDASSTHRRRIDDRSLLEQGTGNREQGGEGRGVRGEGKPIDASTTRRGTSIVQSDQQFAEHLAELLTDARPGAPPPKLTRTQTAAAGRLLVELGRARNPTAALAEVDAVLTFAASHRFWGGRVPTVARFCDNYPAIYADWQADRASTAAGGSISATLAQLAAAADAP